MAESDKKHAAVDQIFTGKLLNVMSSKITSELGTFSSWMIAGMGAIFAIALNGLDKLGPYLNVAGVGISIKIFLVAAALNMLQRYVGALVAAVTSMTAEVEKIAFPPEGKLESFVEIFASAMVWPAGGVARRSFRKSLAGDHMGGPRLIARLSQVVTLLVFIQMVLVIVAAWRLVPS